MNQSSTSSQKNGRVSVTSLPEEFKKTKNRLFYASLLLIIIIIFDPTLTGFLGNFSIKVTNYPTLFIISILFALTWLAIRYLSLFSTIFVDNRLLLRPIKALNEIYTLTSDNKTKIEVAERERDGLIEQLESLNTTHPKLNNQNKVVCDSNIETTKNKLKSKKEQIQGLKIQRTGLKYLIGMDLLIPFFTYLLASCLILWNLQNISKTIHESKGKDPASYQIESATIEVNDIKLKEFK